MKLTVVDRSIVALFISVCAVVIAKALDMQGDAGVIPIFVSVLGVITCIFLLVSTFSSEYSQTATCTVNWYRFGVLSGFIVLLLLSMNWLGALIAIPLFLLASFVLLARVPALVAISLTVGFTVVIYLAFIWALEVPLPLGVLEPWLDS
ncbi:MAG: tripartite tricarboxylate transporter TctB family protein [Amphritea sp.]|nr:tripartite tricarboxylate transporter TctB family protein [Amphritea sp.]